MSAMLGGVMLQAFSSADAMSRKPSGNEEGITEEMVQDFLKRLLAVCRHGDLADREFIAEKLGVTFFLEGEYKGLLKSPNNIIVDRKNFALISPTLPVLQGNLRKHFYEIFAPKSLWDLFSEKVEVSIALVFDDIGGKQAITQVHVRKVFGTPQFVSDENHPIWYYRWRGRDSIVLEFYFSQPGNAVSDVIISQNPQRLRNFRW